MLSEPKVWFASRGWGIVFIALVHAWGVVPLITLIVLAGLQGIPDQIYAAAAVDGANGWQQFRYLTAPLLRPALAVALTMQAYQTTFTKLQYGKGAAFAYLVTLATGLLAIGYVRSLRRTEQ